MLTTVGSIFFASSTNGLVGRFATAGVTSGVASGAATWSLAAFTPVVINVPMTIPIESVNRSRLRESSF
jgi:hypothetical protein